MDAAAEEGLFGEGFDEDDMGGDEDGLLAGRIRDSDFDKGVHVILLAALEAEAALGHVLALDDVVAALGMTNAGGVADFDARMLAAIDGRGGWRIFGGGGRDGEDGGLRFAEGVTDEAGAGGVKVG